MTTEWARGYPVGAPYPASWHPFQSPAHLAAACAVMGVAWEAGPHRPMTVAELGCGGGYTANVLAAGNPNATVLGLDYNPAHIAEARSLAEEAGLPNARFEECDLAALDGAALDALPDFDLVMAHGVWSWVDDRVRDGVLRVLRRKLKPGGLALLTYNALPGAAAALGLWKLVRRALSGPGDLETRIGAARDLVRQLVDAEARHLLPSSWRAVLLEESRGARHGYLLHEFMTAHWRPAFFEDVAEALASARLEHVGSATLDENFPEMALAPPQQALWHAAPDAAARELVKDLCVPRAFRRDLFVRGARRVPRDAASDAVVLACVTHRSGEHKLLAQAGEATLPPHIIGPMQAALAEGPRSVAELRALPGCAGVTPAEAVAMLVGSGVAQPLWRDPGDTTGRDAARRLNAAAARRLAPHGIGGNARLALATPALGGGLLAEGMELAIASALAGLGPAGDALGARDLFARVAPGGVLPPEEVAATILPGIEAMLRDRRAVWRALGIA